MLIHQGLKGCTNCGGGRTIRKFEIAYGISVDFVLNNLGEKSSIFLRVRARDKLLPAYSSSFPALTLVRVSSTIEEGLIVVSGVLAIVNMSPVGIPS